LQQIASRHIQFLAKQTLLFTFDSWICQRKCL
jgi:hypothetical protein